MKPRDRQRRILERVDREGEISVDALVATFDVSAETIRRDLSRLASAGSLQKVHGGARRARLYAEGSFEERMREDAAAKAAIGRKLAGVIHSGDTLFMDTGSTTLACAEVLAAGEGPDSLTVITNSLRIAEVLGRAPGASRVFLLGGGYNAGNYETAGPLAIDQIKLFRADLAVLTVAALHEEAGAMDADFDEAQVARAMVANAGRVVVVAHLAKFGRRAAFSVCPLRDIDILVSNGTPVDPMSSALASAGVSVV